MKPILKKNYFFAAVFLLLALVAVGAYKYHKHKTAAVGQKFSADNVPPVDPKDFPDPNNGNFQQISDYFVKLANKKGARYAFNVLKVAPMAPNLDLHLLGH